MIVITQNIRPSDVELKKNAQNYFGGLQHMSDKVVVFGGDGTLLSAIHERGIGRVYVPFNTGSLGFLTNAYSPYTKEKIANEEYVVHEFNLLKIRAVYDDGSNDSYVGFAVNDIYIERNSGQTARFEIEVDGHSLMPEGVFLGADGLIVSTALGSTAYNFSAGGQVTHPLVPAMNLTPICPHLPKIPPMSLSVDSKIIIHPLEKHKRPVRLVIDGQDIVGDYKRIEVSKYHETLRIAYLDDTDFVSRLVNKIIRRS